ncbi:siderophore ABC transporter substrate-binding protein [Rhodovulum sp. DZ06]|uniref:siderophore ABC transporter substrate-binding protein n=1 Tax=Rhodovulum sp. DZ06 TaxID=3425126 RepID=UPI003D33CB5A
MPAIRALLAAACLTLAAPAAGAAPQDGPRVIQTAAGPLTLESRPERIVALDAAAVDTLLALGHVPVGVPAPMHTPWMDEALAEATQAGTLFEPDFERIAALRPDLVITGGRSAARAAPLAGIAPVADMTFGTDVLAEGLARLSAYGVLLGEEDKADALRAALEAKLERARALAADAGRALIVLTNGPRVSAFGAESRFGWLHSALGWPQAAPEIQSGRHGEAISFEYIAQADPDTLIVIDRAAAIGASAEGARATLDNPLVRGTAAWRTGRVIFLSPAEMYIASGGVQALSRTLDELIAALGEGA